MYSWKSFLTRHFDINCYLCFSQDRQHTILHIIYLGRALLITEIVILESYSTLLTICYKHSYLTRSIFSDFQMFVEAKLSYSEALTNIIILVMCKATQAVNIFHFKIVLIFLSFEAYPCSLVIHTNYSHLYLITLNYIIY